MVGIPSKKIFIALLAGIVMVGGSWLWFGNGRVLLDGTFLGEASKVVIGLITGESENTYTDSDNDDLPDWEETLFGTNPNNKDSDGNRVSDGEQFISLKNIPNIEADDSVLNYLNQVGQSASASGQQITLPKATLEIPPNYFALADLEIVPASQERVKKYTYQVLYAFSIYRDVIEEETFALINRWLQTNDERDLKRIIELSKIHKNLALILAEIKIPDELAVNHLDLINSIYHSGEALGDIDVTVHNPQAGFFAAALYTNYRDKRAQSILTLTEYFNQYIPTDGEG